MGSLVLPASGTVYVDANAVIYSVERIAPYAALLQPLWQPTGQATFRIVTSDLTLLEVLVKPLKTGNKRLETGFRRLLQQSSSVQLAAITHGILERAAALRASTNLKTRDAIHAATALEHGAAMLITNDPVFRQVPGLSVMLLDDLLTP